MLLHTEFYSKHNLHEGTYLADDAPFAASPAAASLAVLVMSAPAAVSVFVLLALCTVLNVTSK
jgi:hypothetical protein